MEQPEADIIEEPHSSHPEPDNVQQQEELRELEALEEEMEENSQRMMARQEDQPQEAGQERPVKEVKNPVSPYMMFVKTWKQRHPTQKFNMSSMGEIWRNMSLSQKEPFESEYKRAKEQWQHYQATHMVNTPTQPSTNKYMLPLHRVRAILKQDQGYAPKVEGTVAMAQAAEAFGVCMLDEIRKMSEGKKTIGIDMLYECINNQRSFGFLDCLIEEHNRTNNKEPPKERKSQPAMRLQMDPVDNNKPQPMPKIEPKSAKKAQQRMGSGQTSLESFLKK